VKAPNRGEVWLFDLGLAAKIRPCLLLGVPSADKDRAVITVIPHTTSVRGTRFEVTISTRLLKSGAFDAQGIVTISAIRLMRQLGTLCQQELHNVIHGVCLWLGIQKVF
jgi:mRNA interferase MazF